MKSTFMRYLMATAILASVAALAQTGSASTSPSASPAATPAATTTPATGTKVGTINIEQAIYNTNEGRRDLDALGTKLQPKQDELKKENDDLEAMKKQLQTQSASLNDDARANLVKQIESKQKSFDRAVQDAREDATNQQNEIAQRILQKMAPMIVKYAGENGFGLIIDTTQPWPQGPVLWYGEAVDITKPVVDIYNAQSGVPAPATPGAASKPAATRPAGSTARPASTGTAPKPAPKPAEPPK